MKHFLSLLCGVWLLTACAALDLHDVAPEPVTSLTPKAAVTGQRYMVVTAHPLASRAARDVLAEGGSATDAAIAAQLVLGVVEPQSSGLGGSGFLLHYTAESQRIQSYDGRNAAPAAATPEMFLQADGTPTPFFEVVRSGQSVSVPGMLAMLNQVHQAHGVLPWERLFAPAIRVAEEGFALSPRLHKSIEYVLGRQPWLEGFAALYLQEDGTPHPVGTLFRNPAQAVLLRRMAQEGISALYEGEVAARIATAVHAAGGILTTEDLKAYQPKEREPVCGAYRAYRVCSMGLPSSGGITLLQTLAMLDAEPLNAPYAVAELHRILEAEKQAFADRNRYLADADFVAVPPLDALLAPASLEQLTDAIDPKRATPVPVRPRNLALPNGADNSVDMPSTTHISIVDAGGNAVSLTSSVEHSFGSTLVVDGIILNNEMTDFAFAPVDAEGRPVANAIQAGKRARSSMTPTLVLDETAPAALRLHAVVGSPGGSSIIPYVRKTLIALLDWKLPAAEALAAPHVMDKNQGVLLEEGAASLKAPLEALGHRVTVKPQSSGVHLIVRQPNSTLLGAADPRREGVALGE